jgi:hypothetical protein
MTIKKFTLKLKDKLWDILVKRTQNLNFYPIIYRSYWNSKINNSKKTLNSTCYYSARPNIAAGIGHQLANWIAGYWFSQQFELKYAHIPFSNQKWDFFLGLGQDEIKVNDLIKNGFKIRKLPLINENNKSDLYLLKSIINSYDGKKIVFIAEQDQFYMDQFGVMDVLKKKFNNAESRKNDNIVYNKNNFNIAVHVRRTVIIDGKEIFENEAAQSLRWLANDYYEKVLKQVLENLIVTKPIEIYLFSTGKPEEFEEFSKYGNVHFCSNMDEYTSFLHLIRADLLITSKSSFSYKPALMSDGIRLCPRNFWHGYPESKDWILVENDGSFDISKLKQKQWKV